MAWLLADTHVHHELAASSYNRRREQCEAAAKAIRVESLRDASIDDLHRIDDPVARRRARHVITEDARVLQAAEILRRGSAPELGPLLYASHQSLRLDFEVSCAELDCLVELAAQVPQVAGARMMGGGFGGCVLILLGAGGIDALEGHLAQGYAREFQRSPGFYHVQSVDGAMLQPAS
jgi:galactokinase